MKFVSKQSAFTLIELMISLALVVVLMLGITKVFSLTSQTAGANNQLSTSLRDGRAAQSVMYQDLSQVVADSPWMIIQSQAAFAFNNAADAAADRDGNPATLDLNGDNVEGSGSISYAGENQSGTTYNYRNHRIDVLSFFARGLFERQTGKGPPLIAQESSNEAMVWYGHLNLPDKPGDPSAVFREPGVGTISTNPNNLYASQWILGRVAILLSAKNAANQIWDQNGDWQNFLFRPSTNAALMPLEDDSKSNTNETIYSCRYDLAATTIDDFRVILNNWIADPTNKISSAYYSGTITDWWSRMLVGQPNGRRFQCNPFVAKPIDANTLSQQVPVFTQRCTQFIVEYAGDYLNQNTTGGIIGRITDTPSNTDGKVDFYIDANGSQKIQWYGFPRETTGDGVINTNGDVIPLRDLLGVTAPFEHLMVSPHDLPVAGGDYGTMSNATNPVYTCAWGPDTPSSYRPKMLRILMTINNSDLPTAEGQTFEYVFTLP